MLANLKLTSCRLFVLGLAVALAGCAAWGGDRSAGQIAEDSAIVASVKARFIADKYVGASSVNVDAYKGVVTLSGDVLSFVEREQAERIASAVRGVVKVENKLTVVD
ncbi:MAG: BON domain-containing protein [Pseudomonadota bacterium]